MALRQFITRRFIGRSVASGGGGGAVAFVQAVNGGNNYGGSTGTAAFASNVTTGNTIVVGIQWKTDVARTIASVTDTLGNTYTISSASKANIVSPNATDGVTTQFAYCNASVGSGANTILVTWSGAVGYGYVTAAEITPATFDQVSKTTGVSAVSGLREAPSITTTVGGCFGMTIAIQDDGTGSPGVFTAGSGWTLFQNSGGGAFTQGAQYTVQSDSGALISGLYSSAGATWAASMITFKP